MALIIRPKYLASLFLLLAYTSILSQDCPDNIQVTSQPSLVSLMEDYPDCEHLAGLINIGSVVTDLSPLANIKTIGGDLWIHNNDVLTDFQGLENLVSVGGSVRIQSSNAVQSCLGLASLGTIGEDLIVTGSDGLLSFQGLDALTHIGRDLNVQISHGIVSLDGLQSLVTVEGKIWLLRLDALASVDELQSLETVNGEFQIERAGNITSINGFPNLNAIHGGLDIFDNQKLMSISGFSGLTSADYIFMQFNNSLQSINGFENLETVDGGLNIDTELKATISAFASLETVGFNLEIEGAESAGFPNLKSVSGDFLMYSEDMTELTGCNMLESVGGDMILQTGLSDLPDFNRLESVGKRLIIDSRQSLEILDGFNALTSVGIGAAGWGFDVFEHDKLVSITGFNNLQNIDGSFVISYCDTLSSVEGFRSLATIEGNFVVRENPLLSDCSPFCDFITSGTVGGDTLVHGNGPFGSSACWDFESVEENCSFSVSLIDANPLYYKDWLGNSEDIRDLEKEDLLDLPETRKALAADGVTEVLLITTFKNEGSISVSTPDTTLELPWGPETYEKDGVHYAFAILRAPDEFPGSSESGQNEDGISIEEFDVSIEFDAMKRTTRTAEIPVVRPPVVLMHGTYSNPEAAWTTSLPSGGATMEDVLTFKGFKVFTVDYSESNGLANPSAFEDNKMALWGEGMGGIKDAVDTYRSLGIAATRADVVGHSMGGVLPRVYASEAYDDESGGKKYKRPENFDEGDINRLITIASTHFGSHLGEFQYFMNNISLIDEGPWLYTVGQLYGLIGDWLAGTPTTGAVLDQLPGSEALAKIGQTQVPSHAITCQVDYGQMASIEDVDNFKLLFAVLAWSSYAAGPYELYLNSKLEKCANDKIKAGTTVDGTDWQNIFKGLTDREIFVTMMEEGTENSSPMYAALDQAFEMAQDIERYNPILSDFAMSDGEESWGQVFAANSDPIVIPAYSNNVPPKTADEIKTEYEERFNDFTDVFRHMIFDNDYNDGTVRVESQAGEMPEDFVTHLLDVWHSSAPKYANVQLRVLELLDSGLEHFNPDGFPAFPEPNVDNPDEGSYGYFQKLYHPPSRLTAGPAELKRNRAICQSGMVLAHANAFARVADRNNVVVISRPVNPDATPLIAGNAATKMMDIKPKSSNWGPQKGYLPLNQRYSKIWRVFSGSERDDKIQEYSEKAMQNIVAEIADSVPVKVELCTEEFWLYLNNAMNDGPTDDNAEDEVVLVPAFDLQQVCSWSENTSTGEVLPSNCRTQEPGDNLVPLYVMASPFELDENGQPRVLTADYDLLMIGFHRGENNPYNPPTNVPFREGVGQMTSEQEALMSKLNDAVFITGYDGGNVTHHGPENQFGKSPYVDYPLTVFAPDGNPSVSAGEIISIPMGPAGFRDIFLKQFVNEMREKGYDLYDNPIAPGWKWKWNEATESFDLADSPDIGDYVDALPHRNCNKSGIPQVNSICRDIIISAAEREHNSKIQGRSESSSASLSVYPNPIVNGFLNIDVTTDDVDLIEYTVSDPLGNIVDRRSVHTSGGIAEDHLSIDHLKPGMYTITINPGRIFTRFVKL